MKYFVLKRDENRGLRKWNQISESLGSGETEAWLPCTLADLCSLGKSIQKKIIQRGKKRKR